MTAIQKGGSSLRTFMLGGFATLLALVLAMAAIGLVQQRALHQRIEYMVEANVKLLDAAGRLQALNGEIGITARDIVNTSNVAAQKENMKRLKAAQAKFGETANAVKAAVETANPGETEHIAKLAAAFAQTQVIFDEILNHVDEADFDAARDSIFKKLRPLQQQVSAQLNDFQERLGTGAEGSATQAERAYGNAILVLGVGVLVCIVVGALIALRVVGRVMTPVGQAMDLASRIAAGDLTARAKVDGDDEVARLLGALNGMAEQLRATLTQIHEEAEKVARQAASLTTEAAGAGQRSQAQVEKIMQVAASVEQMSASISEVSQSASGVEKASGEARQLTEEGNSSMEHNLAEIAQMVSNVDTSQTVIRNLNHELEQINAITNVIKEIADQTNLLALNAAIEAARAGEQGRGFAVVADEVRKLAERTQQSTTEIAGMLAKIDQSAVQAVAAMDQVRASVDSGASDTREVGEKLHRILDATIQVSNLVTTIAGATREQSTTSEVTARSIEAVSGLTGETDATIRGVAATAQEMQTVSTTLQSLVNKFRV